MNILDEQKSISVSGVLLSGEVTAWNPSPSMEWRGVPQHFEATEPLGSPGNLFHVRTKALILSRPALPGSASLPSYFLVV